MSRQLHVSIGEVKIGRNQDVLKASLGSCVGIALLWKQKNIYGLAHCFLPESPAQPNIITARFVNLAVPSLIALMKIKPEQFREIDAVVAGGGNMTAPKQAAPLVGTLNAEAAEKQLKKFGIPIIFKDVGGETGRKITVFCETGEYSVSPIPRIAAGLKE